MLCCNNAGANEYTVGSIENTGLNEIDENDRIDTVYFSVYQRECGTC